MAGTGNYDTVSKTVTLLTLVVPCEFHKRFIVKSLLDGWFSVEIIGLFHLDKYCIEFAGTIKTHYLLLRNFRLDEQCQDFFKTFQHYCITQPE